MQQATELSRAPEEPVSEKALDLDTLGKRARLGVLALLGRTVVMQLIIAIAQIQLARLLDPGDFGIFAIVQFSLSFFAFFGDAGLGAAMIQQKEAPSQRALSSVFFAQVALSMGVVGIVVIAAEGVRLIWPSLPISATWLLRGLSLSLLLTVLRVVPSILLERELRFGRLAILEILHTLAFYTTAVVLAFKGLHVWSLVSAVIAQGVVGVVAAYVMRPWRPSLVFDREVLRPILRFGIPYQLKNGIGFLNGAITPLYAGAVLGQAAVGFINFAQQTAYFPLKLVEIMGRVTFPLYSRVRDNRELFAESLGRSVQICAMGTLFFVAVFLGIGEHVIGVIYSEKWLPSLPLLYVFASAMSIGFVSPLIASAFDAIGRPGIVARLAIGWTVLNWIVVPFAARYGMLGFTIGYIVHVVVGNGAVIIAIKYLVPEFRVMRRLWASIVAFGITVAVARLFVSPWAGSFFGFIGGVLALLLLYVTAIVLLDRRGAADALSIVPGRANSLEQLG